MPDQEIAKKDVASKICSELKAKGELTKENLLPVDHRKENSIDDESEDTPKTAEGTRKNRKDFIRNVSILLFHVCYYLCRSVFLTI